MSASPPRAKLSEGICSSIVSLAAFFRLSATAGDIFPSTAALVATPSGTRATIISTLANTPTTSPALRRAVTSTSSASLTTPSTTATTATALVAATASSSSSSQFSSKTFGVLCSSIFVVTGSLRKKHRRGKVARTVVMAATTAAQSDLPFPEKLDAILFDIDGTLVDSDPVHFRAFVDVLQAAGFNNGEEISPDFFKSRITGRTNDVICRELFPDWSYDQRVEFANNKEAMFRDRAEKYLKPLEGLERLMRWCDDKGLKKAAVTNAPRLNAEFILQCIDRRSWFDELIIGEECEKAKPDPCPYLTAMSRLGVQPSNCIVFEDSPSGASAGVAAGVYTIGLATSQDPSLLRKAGCGVILETFADQPLWDLLERE
eukprot:TRINITY_DN15391_c3_g1_i1.p1 TRINITY_DN15391_c3_g1~~TRINITY_DN15391_c3_g1_i1.p1  ORF type:complete len:374 (+),score=52.79 TRINITY_DN15391_c3_g1_i1:37-1158(+)